MNENNHMVNKEGNLDVNKVDSTIQRMGDEQRDQILSSFNTFKDYLSEKVELGQKLGMSEETLAKTAEKVADFLASNEEPRNREENLLQELWKAGDQEERHKLAHMLVRMVQH